MLSEILEKEILPFVDKPGRYCGGETNSIIKEHTGRTKIALIYPDVYEVGISNIGLKILYDILNREESIVCERAFSPWLDMEKFLREKGLPLFSLETKTPLSGFDILGISFQYELLYTNFLNILDLSGIPFYSKDRTQNHPFIIGGGPVSGNLEPVAPFLDAVCVGDGESRILEMSKIIREAKARGTSRQSVLKQLSEIEGVYVPGLYEEKEEDGYLVPKGKMVKRYIEPDLNAIEFVENQILPNVQAVQDRAVIEAARGCTRGCRFCQAGMTYRPVRERSVNQILSIARSAIEHTGYREFSLISLSVSDYSELTVLIESLDRQFSGHGISFSLPSLRLDSFSLDLAQKVKEIRKSGLTFAVEGGTQAIRDSINKGVEESELLKVIGIAKGLGWKSVKLYFMIGLPFTTIPEEINGIAELIQKMVWLNRGISITVSVALFIPKPHTPFQWEKQGDPEEANLEFKRLIQILKKNRNVNIRFNNPFLSAIEGIFSRGDRRLSRAIEIAFRKGARFDGWNDQMNFGLWKEAFLEAGVSGDFYLRQKPLFAELPWDFVNTGAAKEFFVKELEKASRLELTEDCRDACVNSCGTCDFQEVKPMLAIQRESPIIDENFLRYVRLDNAPKFVCRFLYTKQGAQKYTSPTDLEELFSRTLIRADLPIVFTKGFNPHIRVEMNWALPIGFESVYEVAEIELASSVSEAEWLKKMNAELPAGIRVLQASVNAIPCAKLSKKAKEHFVLFEIESPLDEKTILENREKAVSFEKITAKASKIINLKDSIQSLSVTNGRMAVTYFQKEGGARIQDIIAGLLGLDVRQAVVYHPIIKKRYIEQDGTSILLMEV
jgi:radical SAM family uncharacterized protein/radical SAM-linked protein